MTWLWNPAYGEATNVLSGGDDGVLNRFGDSKGYLRKSSSGDQEQYWPPMNSDQRR
jgi:hypothetical protein